MIFEQYFENYEIDFTRRTLEVRETLEGVELYDGPRRVAGHERVWSPLNSSVTNPAHRPPAIRCG